MKDKNIIFAIIVAIVLAVSWVLSSMASTALQVEVTPNADAYVQQLSPKFNATVLKQVSDRTDTSLIIKPDDFRAFETLNKE